MLSKYTYIYSNIIHFLIKYYLIHFYFSNIDAARVLYIIYSYE